MTSLVVASKRTFGTAAFTNQHAAFQNDQRRNKRRSNGNDKNISNLYFAEFEFKVNSTTKLSAEDMQKLVGIYTRFGDTRNFPLR